MSKILLINPNKWGRGITHIWIASHSGLLKRNGHEVKLFDSTFYQDWHKSLNKEEEYKPTDLDKFVKQNKNDILKDLQNLINNFKPDIIFWSAISSHIHSEGEYVNLQNGYDLIKNIHFAKPVLLITGGLQAISAPKIILDKMNKIDFLIRGESELTLLEIANNFRNKENLLMIKGIAYKKANKIIQNPRQEILKSLDLLCPYDYEIFSEQIFYKPYNGEVLKGIDYEMSRGCIYSCSYCVETIIQKYYGFDEKSSTSGAIKNFKSYLRHKSPENIYSELKYLNKKLSVKLIRCQDTNFLTINRDVLIKLSKLIIENPLDIKLYIETRPEGINEKSVELLKNLKVDGVAMGVETADEGFREDQLEIFADQEKTIKAFKLLKENNIKRTAYNIIGLPNQSESSILDTIKFNRILQPDNISVHFYSPYYGTKSHKDGVAQNLFDDYEFDADAAIRSKSKDNVLTPDKLSYYKKNFSNLVKLS